jgi:hypothetical protein
LIDTAAKWPDFTKDELCRRPLLSLAITEDLAALEKALDAEEDREREQDRNYWLPLKQELERLRHGR